MNQTPALGLPAAIEAAVRRVKLAARQAAERTVDSLGVSALASANVFQRDALLGAQFELNRKLAVFCNGFDETLDRRVEREVLPRNSSQAALSETSWDALSLVDNREMEVQVSAERFGLQIAQDCEAEQRELDGFVGSVLQGSSEAPRNPLRPEVIGNAMIRSVDQLTDRPDQRKVLIAELGRSLAASLPETYAAIVADMRAAGVKPATPSFRGSERGSGFGRTSSGYDTSSRPVGLDDGPQGGGSSQPRRLARRRRPALGTRPLRRRAPAPGAPAQGTPIGHVDAGLMSLIRRLAFTDLGPGAADSGFAPDAAYGPSGHGGFDARSAPVAPNLIRTHREALRDASNGSLDHMVIDVIGSLFDQILSDPKVPPQMARQIARLQLPVLRAALGDPSFFSSRKHPVRRFVNRIASLGSAFEDFDSESGQRFLKLVRELVQEIVEGDFDQIEVYEQKLSVLESFIADQAQREVQDGSSAASLLTEKETDLRLQQRYYAAAAGAAEAAAGGRLHPRLHQPGVEPGADARGAPGRRRQRARQAVAPRRARADHERAAQGLAGTAQGLPDAAAHADEGAERGHGPDRLARVGEEDLLRPAAAGACRIAEGPGAAHAGLQPAGTPGRQRAWRGHARCVGTAAAAGQYSGAARRGRSSRASRPRKRSASAWWTRAAVDWDGKIDIDLSAEPEPVGGELDIAGLPKMEAATEPASGKSLADHVQIGFAYQMHLDDKWQKVRLNHVSPGRSFFVFTHGGRHKKTISMTHRMLLRLCDTGRLRAFENGYLIERATARARRQLAALGGGAAA